MRARQAEPSPVLAVRRVATVKATRRLIEDGSRARILVLTTFDLDEYVYAVISAEASGFLLKDVEPAALVDAIRVRPWLLRGLCMATNDV